jgi:hypothetical protein
MKQLNYRILMTIMLAFVFISGQAQEPATKKFDKTFDIAKGDVLNVENKFGKVEIVNIKEDKVIIEVTLKTDKEGKGAEKFFESVNIVLEKEGNTIKAITELEKFKLRNGSFEINYLIKMPSNLNVNLKNSFGEVIIEELTGQSELKVNYGSLIAQRIIDDKEKPLSSIKLTYCDKSSVKEVNWARVTVAYSDLYIGKGNAVSLLSSYSEVNFGEFNSVAAELSYGDFEIRSVGKLSLKNRYTDVQIEGLSNTLKLDNQYGDVDIKKVTKGFESIVIENQYGDIDIRIEDGAEYRLNADVKYCDMSYPAMKVIKKIKEDSRLILQAVTSEGAKAGIEIDSQYGDVQVE